MNIQIYGTKKCFDTQKAERYFKERGVSYQYVDLFKYGLSKGEHKSVKSSVGLENMINPKAKEYKALNLHRISVGNSSREEILLQNPKLCNTPIVRNGKQATVGFQPEVWGTWE
jgi:arsenate reductase-like glutaredoxin family protein